MEALSGRHARELQLILESARTGQAVSVEELQRALDVSTATIYNDLQFLSRLRVTRSRGAVQLTVDEVAQQRLPERFALRTAVKAAVADLVVRDLPVGSIVYLDTGSTCYSVAEAILAQRRSDVGIVTANPYILHLCSESALVHDVVALGGVLRQPAASLYGDLTVTALSQVTFDVAIISVDFIHADNVGTLAAFSDAEVPQKRAAIRRAARSVIVVGDDSKLERTIGYPIRDLQSIAQEKRTLVVLGSEGSLVGSHRERAVERLVTALGASGEVMTATLDGLSNV